MTYVLFRELTEDYSLGNSLSDTYEKVFKNGKRGARKHRSFCWGEKKKHVVKYQNVANYKNQTSQVNDFSVFLYMGRCKRMSALKLFLRYASQLSRGSVLFFSILNSPKGITLRMAAMADGRKHSFLMGMAVSIYFLSTQPICLQRIHLILICFSSILVNDTDIYPFTKTFYRNVEYILIISFYLSLTSNLVVSNSKIYL